MDKKKLTLKEIGFKRLAVIGLAGILLIILSVPDLLSSPGEKKSSEEETKTQSGNGSAVKKEEEDYVSSMEKRLSDALTKVQGIGKAEVVITLKGTKERVTLKDTPYKQESVNEADSGGGSRVSSNVEKGDETVLVKSLEGESIPYVVKELEPEVNGVLVIAQGGDNPAVISEINSAIEVLFGIPVHKIKVMKMVNEGKLPETES